MNDNIHKTKQLMNNSISLVKKKKLLNVYDRLHDKPYKGALQ